MGSHLRTMKHGKVRQGALKGGRKSSKVDKEALSDDGEAVKSDGNSLKSENIDGDEKALKSDW